MQAVKSASPGKVCLSTQGMESCKSQDGGINTC